jgi:hypothetical protein
MVPFKDKSAFWEFRLVARDFFFAHENCLVAAHVKIH